MWDVEGSGTSLQVISSPRPFAVANMAAVCEDQKLVSYGGPGEWRKRIYVWCSETVTHTVLLGHTDSVTCVAAMRQNDEQAVSSSNDGIRVWDVEAYVCIPFGAE